MRAALWSGCLGAVALLALAFAVSFANGAPQGRTKPPAEIVRFIRDKERHAHELAKQLNLDVSPRIWTYIKSAATSPPVETTNAYERLIRSTAPAAGAPAESGVTTAVWQIVVEIELAVEPFAQGADRYALAFGRAVLDSIPRGSIYFGGTEAGRGLPTALSKSQAKADPIFTLTQRGLANGLYLEYIRATYGDRIRTPTTEDSQRVFQEYLADAQRRLEHDERFPSEPRQIKPVEDVRVVDKRVQVSGHGAVMAINERLVRTIFDANPDREFYIEQSVPIDWMYPHLSPHGFILKVDRTPVGTLNERALEGNRRFWLAQQKKTIGAWLTPSTSVQEVCKFAIKVFSEENFDGFTGDRHYVQTPYSNRLFSKLRNSQAGVYAWRASHAPNLEERRRMMAEADFSFRQAFALCPRNLEVVFSYIDQLVTNSHFDDAIRVAECVKILEPGNAILPDVIADLKRRK